MPLASAPLRRHWANALLASAVVETVGGLIGASAVSLAA